MTFPDERTHLGRGAEANLPHQAHPLSYAKLKVRYAPRSENPGHTYALVN